MCARLSRATRGRLRLSAYADRTDILVLSSPGEDSTLPLSSKLQELIPGAGYNSRVVYDSKHSMIPRLGVVCEQSACANSRIRARVRILAYSRGPESDRTILSRSDVQGRAGCLTSHYQSACTGENAVSTIHALMYRHARARTHCASDVLAGKV